MVSLDEFTHYSLEMNLHVQSFSELEEFLYGKDRGRLWLLFTAKYAGIKINVFTKISDHQ